MLCLKEGRMNPYEWSQGAENFVLNLKTESFEEMDRL